MTESIATASQPDAARVEMAKALTEQLRKSAPESDRRRRLSEEDVDAIDSAGLFSLCTPARLGGLETNVRTLVDVIAAVAYGNGAAGWVTSLINTSAFMAALYPDQAQRDVWGTSPKARVATVFDAGGVAEPVEGGYRVSGNWGFASGSLHAEWANLGIVIPNDGGEDALALALLPACDYSISDTWFTAGMRGTGSNTVIVEDAFIPEHRVHGFEQLLEGDYRTEHRDEALYRATFLPVGTVILAAPQLGMARAVLDLSLDVLPRRSVKYTSYTRSVDAPTIQMAVAQAASEIDAAELLLHRATTEIDELAVAGVAATRVQRARARMDTGHAITLCRTAIDRLMTANGASAFAELNPVQQFWRDSATASRHAFAEPEIGTEIYGRELLGVANVMPI